MPTVYLKCCDAVSVEGHDIEPLRGVVDGHCTALRDTIYIMASIDLRICIRTVCQEVSTHSLILTKISQW